MAYGLLLVDDDERFLDALEAYLANDARFHVLGTAKNGLEGCELASALRPDVVLMDIDMPVMDGVEASRRIHREHPELPIVVVSASQFVDRVAQARDAGATGYVQKGRMDSDLIATVAAAAAGRPHDAPSRLCASLANPTVET